MVRRVRVRMVYSPERHVVARRCGCKQDRVPSGCGGDDVAPSRPQVLTRPPVTPGDLVEELLLHPRRYHDHQGSCFPDALPEMPQSL
jgi:hypothetical protein